MAIAEEDVDAVRILALCLQQIAVSLFLLEGQKYDVIRKVMHIRHLRYAVNMQGIAPDGVLADVELGGRLVGVVRVGQHLTLLGELVVIISILQGIDTVFARRHTLDTKVSVGIGPGHTQ